MTLPARLTSTVAVLGISAALLFGGTGTATAAPAPQQAVAAAPALTQARATTLVPTRVTGFRWIAGNRSWASANERRLLRSAFVIDGRTFTMRQPDGYPTLTGRIARDGSFTASAGSRSGNSGSTTVEIAGRVGTGSNGVRTMTLSYVSGATLAAVVNGTSFGSSRTKAYQATLTLRAR